MVKPRAAAVASLVLMAGCVGERERRQPPPAPVLTEVVPAQITAGRPFQVQPDGSAVLSVLGRNLFRGTRVRWEGELLDTAAGGAPRALAAAVPPHLYAQPGTYRITVEQPGGLVSNAMPVTVFSTTGPAPAIAALFPEATAPGKLFNPQPSGQAALALTGANFLPGIKVIFGGVALETVFGGADRLAALVPAALIAQPRTVVVAVRNPDGKVSPPASFTIAPGR